MCFRVRRFSCLWDSFDSCIPPFGMLFQEKKGTRYLARAESGVNMADSTARCTCVSPCLRVHQTNMRASRSHAVKRRSLELIQQQRCSPPPPAPHAQLCSARPC